MNSDWIPVAERLPQDGALALITINVQHRRFRYVIARYTADLRCWATEQGFYFLDDVTHWMPLPPLPEAGND